MAYKFKKSESFYIREGWFEKAINTIKERDEKGENPNVFYKNDGIKILGIGSNMVKSLRYWLQSANVIDKKAANNRLTEFGDLIYKYDRYLDDQFCWFLIHYHLVNCKEECPIFYMVFSSPIKTFTKREVVNLVEEKLISDHELINKKYIEDDTNTFLKSYVNDKPEENPEDNFICPLSHLGLMKQDGFEYVKTSPNIGELDPLIVGYILNLRYGKSFNIEDSYRDEFGPARIFNLDKSSFLQYLDALKKKNLITINKTAGLNSVYFERTFSLQNIFSMHFGGKE